MVLKTSMAGTDIFSWMVKKMAIVRIFKMITSMRKGVFRHCFEKIRKR